MKTFLICLLFSMGALCLAGCSVFGDSGVEIAPYAVLEKEGNLELRHYERLVLVTTTMKGMEDQKDPFYKLFDYISGKNAKKTEISMTAPVFMDQGDNMSESMSFVLPESFSIKDAPVPMDPSVKLEEIKDYTVAVISFSGFLNQKNIDRQKVVLENWITRKGFKKTGAAKAAGYNPPYTIPAFRRNEVLIPVKKTLPPVLPGS